MTLRNHLKCPAWSSSLLRAVVLAAGLASVACSDDESKAPTATGNESNPAVMVVGQSYTTDDYLTYVRVFSDVPEGEVDFATFREFGNANAYSHGGYVFVEEESTLKRFSVNEDLELVDGPILSWADYGISAINASYTVFASEHRAYTFAPELGVVLVWDPELMERTATLEVEMPERPESMETWAYDGHLVGDKVVWNVFSGDFANNRSYPAVTLAITDAHADAPVHFVEDERCLGGGPSWVDENGDYYVQAGGYYGYFFAYGNEAGNRTCMLRMESGEDELDPGFALDYEGLTGNGVTDLWMPIGKGRYLVRAWDPDISYPTDSDDFWDNAALHSLLVDTRTQEVTPYPDLEGVVSIDGTAREVDGVSYYQLNEEGYVEDGEVDVYELKPDGIRKKFHLGGFLLGLERVR